MTPFKTNTRQSLLLLICLSFAISTSITKKSENKNKLLSKESSEEPVDALIKDDLLETKDLKLKTEEDTQEKSLVDPVQKTEDVVENNDQITEIDQEIVTQGKFWILNKFFIKSDL